MKTAVQQSMVRDLSLLGRRGAIATVGLLALLLIDLMSIETRAIAQAQARPEAQTTLASEAIPTETSLQVEPGSLEINMYQLFQTEGSNFSDRLQQVSNQLQIEQVSPAEAPDAFPEEAAQRRRLHILE